MTYQHNKCLDRTHLRGCSNSPNPCTENKVLKSPVPLISNNSDDISLQLQVGMEIVTSTELVVGQKKRRRKGTGINGGESEHDTHILTERERRKKMRNMFSNLHALLPQLPPKTDKSTIVDEAVKYIQSLEEQLRILENQKLEKPQGATIIADCEPISSVSTPQTHTPSPQLESSRAAAGPSNNKFPPAAADMIMSQRLPAVPASPSCFQTWFSPNVVLNMCGDDAHISVCSLRRPGLLTTVFCILQKHNLDVMSAHISSDQHQNIYMIHARASGASSKYALPVEDTFKLAAGELNLWLLSC